MLRKWALPLLAAAMLLVPAGLIALAQGGYELSWWTVDGGGHTYSTGGGYELGGTIGQPDAGVLAGGGYTLSSGYWRGGAVVRNPYLFCLPLVLRQAP
jgi:hypothetical protein